MSVLGARQLMDLAIEIVGELRHARHVTESRGHDSVVCAPPTAGRVDEEAIRIGPLDPLDAGGRPYRGFERLGVDIQISSPACPPPMMTVLMCFMVVTSVTCQSDSNTGGSISSDHQNIVPRAVYGPSKPRQFLAEEVPDSLGSDSPGG